jgi:nucleoside phosphorylase
MRILVTFAVDAEFAPWRKIRGFSENDDPKNQWYTARFGEIEADVLLAGIGGKSAWLETMKRVWKGDIGICISSGLAGALRPEYRAGDILAARRIQVPAQQRTVECDADLLRAAAGIGAREAGAFYSAEKVILSKEEKAELGKAADAVEMESGDVLYQAAALGARVIAIRGISDEADEDLPLDFNRVSTPSGEVSMKRVLGEVAKHPTQIPALIRFGHQSKVAAERLCEFLDKYVERLASGINAKEAAR